MKPKRIAKQQRGVVTSERTGVEMDAAERKMLREKLRYMDPEEIAKEFPGERERAAIAAVFKWLSLNAVVASSMKTPGQYDTNWSSLTRGGKWVDDAVVLDRETLRRAEALFE